jgi:hypothetical protein
MSIANNVVKCLQTFRTALIETSTTADGGASTLIHNKIENENARFKLWAGNVGAHHKGRRSLEYRLRDSSALHSQVVLLIESLIGNIAEGILPFFYMFSYLFQDEYHDLS